MFGTSIIIIGGLGTNAFGTFRSPENDQMWLRDFLKDDIANIRVLLYGYESKVDNSRSAQTIEDIARSCLEMIVQFRKATDVSWLQIFPHAGVQSLTI